MYAAASPWPSSSERKTPGKLAPSLRTSWNSSNATTHMRPVRAWMRLGSARRSRSPRAVIFGCALTPTPAGAACALNTLAHVCSAHAAEKVDLDRDRVVSLALGKGSLEQGGLAEAARAF